jgi:hypothetical protein
MNSEFFAIEQEILAEKFIATLNERPLNHHLFHVINFRDMNATVSMIDNFFAITEYDSAQERQAMTAMGQNEFDSEGGTTEILSFAGVMDEDIIVSVTQAFSMQYSNASEHNMPTVETVTGTVDSEEVIRMIIERWKAFEEMAMSVVH